MARPRFFTAKPELQAAVIAAALREFAQNGYEGASLNQILATANLGKGSFYYYFDDKADLAATVVRKTYDEIVESTGGLTVARDVDDFWASVAAMERRSMETVQRSRDSGEAVARIVVAAQRDPHLAALLAPVVQEASALAAVSWKRGQAMGAVRKDVDVQVLVALMGAIKETIIRLHLPSHHAVRPKDADRMAALVLDMIRRVAEPAPRTRSPARTKTKPEVRAVAGSPRGRKRRG